MEIDILIEDFGWFTLGLEDLAERACPAVLAELGLEPDQFEVSILACDDDRIAALNGEFRQKPTPTNVLSWPARCFPAHEDGIAPAIPAEFGAGPLQELGDIAIAYGICLAEAEALGKALSEHASHLLVHAMLHLLGYDHERDGDAALMQGLETRILARLGLPDPY